MLVFGQGSALKSGLIDRVEASLAKAGVASLRLGGVLPNPRSGLVYEGIRLARDQGADFVLAVGGGSAIDTGKAIAAGVPYAGDFWDLFEQKAPVASPLPIGCVLTISAAGSEGSNSSVITQEKGMRKQGLTSELFRPVFSIMNPELTYGLPAYQKACGAADMMAHVLERYFCPNRDNDLTDRLCEALLQAIMGAAPLALQMPPAYDPHAQLMWAGTLAHNDTCGVGRLGDWGVHAMGHELSARYDAAHGATLAALFPSWMRYQMHQDVSLFAQLGHRAFGAPLHFDSLERTAAAGIDALEAFFRRIGLPTSLEEMNVPREDIPGLAATVRFRSPDALGTFRPLSREDVAAVFDMAWPRKG